MTRIEYFLAWPPERVAQLAAEQEARIKELEEQNKSLHEAWRALLKEEIK